MSVDVEEWFQVGAFERVIARDDCNGLGSRVERNTGAVLDLFEAAGVKATFFTLGCIADRHPALIRRIVAAGHEIASHGWGHRRVHTMTPTEFRADLLRSRGALEGAGGVSLTGYRAPSFSIDARTPWAYRVWRRRATPIPPASRPCGTTLMVGARLRATPSARSKTRGWSRCR